MTYTELRASLPPFVIKLIDGIIKTEAGFVDNKNDSGGATKYGITEKVARADGYTGDMRDLPIDRAFTIYLKQYYRAPGFDLVAVQSEAMAEELTDTGVNMGQGKAQQFLNTALTVVNQKDGQQLYDDQSGKLNMNPVAVAVACWGESELVKILNCLQGAGYVGIANRNVKNRTFTFGWLTNRVVLPKPNTCRAQQVHADYALIGTLSPQIAWELSDIRDEYDAGVAGIFLQQCLNALNCDKRGNPIFADLTVDGKPGQNTRDAITAFFKVRGLLDGGNQLVKALNCMQGSLICDKALADKTLRGKTIEWYQTRIQMPCR